MFFFPSKPIQPPATPHLDLARFGFHKLGIMMGRMMSEILTALHSGNELLYNDINLKLM